MLLDALGKSACIPLLIRNRTYQIRCIKLSRDEKNMIFGQKLSKLRVLTGNNYRVVSCYISTATVPTKNIYDKIVAYQSVITSLQYFSVISLLKHSHKIAGDISIFLLAI